MSDDAAPASPTASATARTSIGQIIWRSIVTLVFPGYAQARYSIASAITWVVIALVAVTAILFEIWMVWGLWLVHLASAVEAFFQLRRRRATTLPLPVKYGVGVIVFSSVMYGFVAQTMLQSFKIPASSGVPTLAIGDHVMVNKLRRDPSRGDVIVFAMPCMPERAYVKRVIAVAKDTVELRCKKLYINGKEVREELVDANSSYRDQSYDTGEWRDVPAERWRSKLGETSFELFHSSSSTARDFPQPDAEPPSCAVDGYPGASSDQRAGTVVVTKPGATECEQQAHFVVPEDSLFVMGDNRENSADSRYWGVVPTENVTGRVIGIYFPFGRVGNLD